MATNDELKASYQALAKSYDTLAEEADDVEQSGNAPSLAIAARADGGTL